MAQNNILAMFDTLQAVANTGRSACITLSSDCKVENVRLSAVENARFYRSGQEVKTETMSASDPVKQASDRINALERDINTAFIASVFTGKKIQSLPKIDAAFSQPMHEANVKEVLGDLCQQWKTDTDKLYRDKGIVTKSDLPMLQQ